MYRMDQITASLCTITNMETGRIMKIVSNRYEVLCGEQMVPCVAMGKLRKGKSPIVGDYVEIERFEDQNGIQKILPRHNELRRPPIANVDQAIIVMSCKDPDFSTTLIDRLIFQIAYAHIEPVICITKTDLIPENDAIFQSIQAYKESGYRVYTSSKQEAEDAFIAALKGKISVLTGQSGAGKSSLLNRIDPTFHLQTQEISKALGRGKHTTRHCELHEIAGGWVADTPGFSSMDFSHMDIIALAECIPDFKPFVQGCQFRDCKHLNEPNCAIQSAILDGTLSKDRYEHYKEVVQMISQYKRKY